MFLIPPSFYKVKKNGDKGRGVFVLRDIAPGTIMGDYIGTITRPYANDEKKNGLYDMQCGRHYDVVGDKTQIGAQLVNHSCVNNTELYPYRGHVLYVAARKIFAGEEMTANYGLGIADEKDIPCILHACHCGSKMCHGTMHSSEEYFEKWYNAWESLVKRNFGKWYYQVPGKYGTQLPPLGEYPANVTVEKEPLYQLSCFGSEVKPPSAWKDETIPDIRTIRIRIRESGRRLAFPKLHLVVYGVRDGMLIAEKKS
jgi:hypothetical protein